MHPPRPAESHAPRRGPDGAYQLSQGVTVHPGVDPSDEPFAMLPVTTEHPCLDMTRTLSELAALGLRLFDPDEVDAEVVPGGIRAWCYRA